jgi:hypothetical protein
VVVFEPAKERLGRVIRLVRVEKMNPREPWLGLRI